MSSSRPDLGTSYQMESLDVLVDVLDFVRFPGGVYLRGDRARPRGQQDLTQEKSVVEAGLTRDPSIARTRGRRKAQTMTSIALGFLLHRNHSLIDTAHPL